MWRNKLRAPLSSIFRRVLLSSSLFGASKGHLSVFSSSTLREEQESRVFQGPRCHLFLPNLRCYGRGFSSEPAGQFCCWNCGVFGGSKSPFLVCESCGSVQPVNESFDYFNIFGLEKKYEIEVCNLEGMYKGWQKKLHPDLVHTKSEKEREYAAAQSARVIDAYKTLTDPLSRAIYILKLEAVNVNEEETISDPELLAEIMEIREAVEGAASAQTLHEIQAQIQEKLMHWSKAFANAFQSRDYEDAITSTRRMSYYKRASEEIVKKL